MRHLLNQQEILGLRLLSLHNLRFVLDLVAGARDAIERGRLAVVQGGGAGAAAARRGGIHVGSYLIIIIALFGALWLFLIRPQKRRQVEQSRMQDDLAAGDEILTAGGIHGTVRAIEGEVVAARDRAGHDRPPRPAGRCRRRTGGNRAGAGRNRRGSGATRPRPAKANLSRLE